MMHDLPTHLHCVECGREWEVSEEDADTTLDDAFDHLRFRHRNTAPITAIKPGKAKA